MKTHRSQAALSAAAVSPGAGIYFRPDSSLSKVRADWMARHPFKDTLPDYLNTPRRDVSSTTSERVADMRCAIDAKLNQADEEGGRSTYRMRRKIEGKIADYIEGHAAAFLHVRELFDMPSKLRACRRSGAWGERCVEGHGKIVMGWDFKCGSSRLCPDEARTEQRRLVRRYRPAIRNWVRERPGLRRIHKGVLTWPNVEPGQLGFMKREMFRWLPKLTKAFPVIHGVLASQEDPLSSARDDWNVHINIVLCVEGRFDWGAFRAKWTELTKHLFPTYEGTSFQVEMRELPRCDEGALDDALREVLKYAVKHQDMSDLKPERFLEWWNAGQRFRRTRSYGCLFRVGEPDKEKTEVTWYGRVSWDERAKAYAVFRSGVDLTQANKSGAKTQHVGGAAPPTTTGS